MSKLIPRLSFSELDPQLAEVLRPKVERLRYLGEFFQCVGHQPNALIAFHSLTEDLRKCLPDNLTELVALTIATIMGNAYERIQHERLALKLGFSAAWLKDVISLQPHAGGELTRSEAAVQQLAIAILERQGHDTTEELEAVIHVVGHEQAIAVLMLIGRYVMHALIANCLSLEPPVTSPLQV